MRLNPDCVRDILLTAESICEFNTPWKYDKSQPLANRLENYSYNEIFYHLSQMSKSGLLDNVHIYEELESFFVGDISPSGHAFIANIRNDTFFNKVKNIAKELGLNSLNDFTQIALNCSLLIIKSHFNLP